MFSNGPLKWSHAKIHFPPHLPISLSTSSFSFLLNNFVSISISFSPSSTFPSSSFLHFPIGTWRRRQPQGQVVPAHGDSRRLGGAWIRRPWADPQPSLLRATMAASDWVDPQLAPIGVADLPSPGMPGAVMAVAAAMTMTASGARVWGWTGELRFQICFLEFLLFSHAIGISDPCENPIFLCGCTARMKKSWFSLTSGWMRLFCSHGKISFSRMQKFFLH